MSIVENPQRPRGTENGGSLFPISPIVPEGTSPVEEKKEKSKLFLAVGTESIKIVLDGEEKEISSTALLWPVLKFLAEGTDQGNGVSIKDFIEKAREAGIEGDDGEIRRKALGNVKNFFDNNFGRKDMIINIRTDRSEFISSDARSGRSTKLKTVGYKLNADIFSVNDTAIQQMREDGLIKARSAKSNSQGATEKKRDGSRGKPVEVGNYEDVGKDRFIFKEVERLILAYWIDQYIKSLAELTKQGITFTSGEDLIRITGMSVRNIRQIIENNKKAYLKEKNERGRIAADVLQKANDFSLNSVDLRSNFISKLDQETNAELICLLNLIGGKGFMGGLIAYILSLKKDN